VSKPKRVGYRHYTYRGFDIFNKPTGWSPVSGPVWAWGVGQRHPFTEPRQKLGSHSLLRLCVEAIDAHIARQKETAQ